MSEGSIRLGLPTVAFIAVIVGAAAFAAGRATGPAQGGSVADAVTTGAALAPLAAHTHGGGSEGELPVGHPPVADDLTPLGSPSTSPVAESQASVEWKAPPRWLVMPNTSTMRLATYKIPPPAGATGDAELSIMQAGGTVDANVERWIAQFDETSRRSAKRTTREIHGTRVTIVEIEGTFEDGMRKNGPQEGWALMGAIIATPGMHHFFKMTGPAKTVRNARAELDALVSGLVIR